MTFNVLYIKLSLKTDINGAISLEGREFWSFKWVTAPTMWIKNRCVDAVSILRDMKDMKKWVCKLLKKYRKIITISTLIKCQIFAVLIIPTGGLYCNYAS